VILDVGSGAITTIIQGIAGSPAGITDRPVTYIVEMAWNESSTTGTIKHFQRAS